MTIRELYEWAVENRMQDAKIMITDMKGNEWPADIERANMDEVTLS